jgi:hypothetical protein
MEQNDVRTAHLKHYSSCRHYQVEFHGFGRSMNASMDVEASYDAASGKSFRVIDESGSHVLLNHVLHKLLDTEKDDSREKDSGLTPANYEFKYLGTAFENGRQQFMFRVEPKARKKLLYRGKIWVDAHDYALVKVEAEPAVNPSFWIKNTNIHQLYLKSGEFWLPAQNRSETKVRMGGIAILTIDYGAYQIDAASSDSPLTADRLVSNQ